MTSQDMFCFRLVGYFPGHNPGLATAQLTAPDSSRSDQILDHVLQRLLARAEHLHQEEVEEQQAQAGPAGPGGGGAGSYSQVRKLERGESWAENLVCSLQDRPGSGGEEEDKK